ncbi:MAG: VanZ family protein [Muribaculum sp.]|nr:VanZ family protein [Muribaculum sp.]
MKTIKEFLERLPKWTLTIICLAAILWLTLASKPLGDNDIQLFPHADKVAHAIMFGGFTFCILIDWMRKRDWRKCSPGIATLASVAAMALGIVTEILQQSMHAGRSGDSLDLLADTAGAILTAIVFCSIHR